MESLLGKLGIDWRLLIGQIVNFLIFLFVVNKFVFKPLMEVMKKRTARIEEGLHMADERDELHKEMLKEKEVLLGEARKESEKIIAASSQKAKEARTTILEETRIEARSMFEAAQVEMTAERQKMYKELRDEVGTIAIAISERILKEHLNKDKEEKMIKEVLKELQ